MRALTPEQHPVPTSQLKQSPNRLLLQAHIPASALPPTGELLLGLSAVIELDDGRLFYWALSHPSARPDFHDRRGWRLMPDVSPWLSHPQHP